MSEKIRNKMGRGFKNRIVLMVISGVCITAIILTMAFFIVYIVNRYNASDNIEVGISIIVTLILAGLIAALTLALRELFKDKDDYRREVNKILRRFSDEVVVANEGVEFDYPSSLVADFKQLIKFSQNLSKPIVYIEKPDRAQFYILCDNVVYKYEIKKPELNTVEEKKPEAKTLVKKK